MVDATRKLRKRKPVSYCEIDSDSSEESEFFESSSTTMPDPNMDELLQQIQNLQRDLNSLRVSGDRQQDGARSNLQRVHIPKFNERNPDLWFAQIERSFALCEITSDSDKFDVVSVRLEGDVLLSVEDLVTNPPVTDKYATLKERLISKFSESSESKLRRLIQGGETNDMKPTSVLAHMKRLAPGKGNEAIIRTLFLGQMPETMRPFLTAWEEEDLEKLAKIADKMFDASNNNTASSVSAVQHQPIVSNSVDAISSRMSFSDICQAIKELSEKVDRLQQDLGKNKRYDQRHRSKSRSRSRGPLNADSHDLCYFHRKFGDAARNCKPDCSRFKSEN